jgi:hypothetical protein
VTVVVVVGLVTLNVLGVLRYPGGPLRESDADGVLWLDTRPADQGSIEVGGPLQIGLPVYTSVVQLQNAWPISATVEAVTPVDPTPGLVIDHVWIGRPGSPDSASVGLGPDPGLPDGTALDDLYMSFPGAVPASGTDVAMAPILIQAHASALGDQGFAALAVDYRVGPFSFRVIQHLAVSLCVVPLPPQQGCAQE